MSYIQDLYKRAKKLMPGGTQLLSKRPEMFAPNQWPTYYKKAKGCEVIDIEGNKFIDMSYMGIGSCTLGFADKDVDSAVKEAIDNGSMSTLNSSKEVELAELLLELHPWADQVRYTRSGGEAMAVAVRLARANTGKDTVLFCGYHGWHDWYLAANLSEDDALGDGHLLPGLNPLGVPKALKGTAIPFGYNKTDEFLDAFEKNKDSVGTVVIEVIRNMYPNSEFFQTIKETCDREGIVLIFDEITSGFRLNSAGAHIKFGGFAKKSDDNSAAKGCGVTCSCKRSCYAFEPDIAVYAKAMTNGYPMSAIIGKKEVMNFAQDTFVSSLYWTESIGTTATLATIRKIINEDVPTYTEALGVKTQSIWTEAANTNGLNIKITGPVPQLSIFSFDYDNSLELKTLFNQEMLKRGFLTTTAFYPSFAHKETHLLNYEVAVNEVFQLIKDAIKKNRVGSTIKGPTCHSGFKRLT